MSIYQEIILQHFKKPKNFGRLSDYTSSAQAVNPLCGDKFSMQLKIEKGIVKDIAFEGEGCAISTASASLLSEYVKNKKILDLKNFDKSVILKLLGIELSANRLKCALLPLELLHKTIGSIKNN